MKKNYKAPEAELVKFNYTEQVVASNGGGSSECITVWTRKNGQTTGCNSQEVSYNN